MSNVKAQAEIKYDIDIKSVYTNQFSFFAVWMSTRAREKNDGIRERLSMRAVCVRGF